MLGLLLLLIINEEEQTSLLTRPSQYMNMAAGDSGEQCAPLLPEFRQHHHEEEKGASVSGAVFNVSTTIIGAGIMSIPATLKILGVVPAMILILMVALLSELSAGFLLKYTKSAKSYAGAMGDSFGKVGSVALQLCVMITTLGTLIVYLIIIGDVLSGTESDGNLHLGILQQWFGRHWWNSRAFTLFCTVIFVMLPLALLRRVESLRFTSAISMFLAVVFVLISSVMAICALWEGTTKSPKLLPDFTSQTSFMELFTAVPVIVTAFAFHFNVHPIVVELSKPSDMVCAVRISLIICAAIYCTVGFFGYLLFGESTMGDVLANFDQNFSSTAAGSFLNDTVRLSYALHLMLVFPLLNFSLRVNMDGLLFPRWPLLSTHTIRFTMLTCFLLAFIYLAAIAIPSIWYFFQFLGSTTAVCLVFVFPGAIVLRDVHGMSTRSDKILAALMVLVAVISSSIAISSNIRNSTGSSL